MERNQIDASFAYRLNEQASVFVEGQNLNDEDTRLYARYPECFLSSRSWSSLSLRL